MRFNSISMAALALAGALAAPAMAAVVTIPIAADLSAAPATYSFGGGNSVTFSTVNPGFSFDPTGVSTSGTVQILSLGAPFYDPVQPTSFFADRGGSIGPDTLGVFASYATPSVIRFSITESIIGLRFDLGNGFQYGYADIGGSQLFGVRFETTPGIGVAIAAIDAGGIPSGVPEPAGWALLVAGFGLTGAALRGRRRALA